MPVSKKHIAYERIPKEFVLLLVDGEEIESQVLLQFASKATSIICTDGAAEVARKHKLAVSAIVGDLDSVTGHTLEWYKMQGSSIIQETEQETDDLEKTLQYLQDTGYAGDVRVLNLTGGRIDHTFVNFSVLLRFNDCFRSLIAYDNNFEMRFLTECNSHYQINAPKGHLVSLIPLPAAYGVTTEGLAYPLSNADMVYGKREGLSNVAIGDVSVSITSGSLLITTEL